MFTKDDTAGEMFLVVTGRFLVVEIGIEIPPGRLLGNSGSLRPKTGELRPSTASRMAPF